MEFEKVFVESSIIDKVGYDELKKVLRVWLNSGRVYDYFNVPKSKYQSFLKAESKGSYYNHIIKKLFKYQEK